MAMFLHALKQSGALDHLSLTVSNVGSRKMDAHDDYATLGWGVFAPNLSIYGFDADAATCDEANDDLAHRNIDWVEKHLPLALADKAETRTLYVTKHPMCSSLYPPNEDLLCRFNDLGEVASLDHTTRIQTTTLDQYCAENNISGVDFLQVDVQGADLLVLKGAQQILDSSTLAVQVEVEFQELYSGQPLFADLDTWMRAQGFKLHELHPTRRVRAASPIHSTIHPGQLLWGEAYYLRDLLDPETDSRWVHPDHFLKLACIADILDFADYAYELLEQLVLRYGSDSRYNVADIMVQQLDTVYRAGGDALVDTSLYEKLAAYVSPAMDTAIRVPAGLSNAS